MSAAVTRVAAGRASSKCRICRRPAPPGARLCSQCKAAVRRARQVPTVLSGYLPTPPSIRASRGAAGSARRPARARAGHRGPSLPIAGGWVGFVASVAFGAAVCTTGYLAARQSENRALQPATVSPALPVAHLERIEVTRAIGAPLPPPSGTPDEERPAGTEGTRVVQEPLRAQPMPRPADRKVGAVAARAGVASPSASRTVYIVDDRTADAGSSEGDDVQSPPAVVAASGEPPAPDRWQALASALARCEGQGLLAGVICGQRARLQYCEGHWREVPQCSAARRDDSGR